MGMSSSPTRITHPSIVARLISTPASRSRITHWRCRGRWSLYFAITVFHLIADQTLFDDPRWNWGRRHAAFLAMLAGALFALGHHYEVLGGLYIQLFADVVANH